MTNRNRLARAGIARIPGIKRTSTQHYFVDDVASSLHHIKIRRTTKCRSARIEHRRCAWDNHRIRVVVVVPQHIGGIIIKIPVVVVMVVVVALVVASMAVEIQVVVIILSLLRQCIRGLSTR